MNSLIFTSFRNLYILLVLLLFCSSITSQNFIITPYLQNGSPNSMTVMWETDAPNDGFVDWGDSAFALVNTVTSTTVVSNGANRIHTAIISGLSPDTKYFYKVRTTSGEESNIYSFNSHPTKASESPLNFVAMSDMQRDGSNPGIFESIINDGVIPVANASYTNGIDDVEAILIPGDLVVTGSYSSWRNDFFELTEDITPFVPMYPVAGNHEYFGAGVSLYLDYFDLPLNGSPSNPEEWWFKDISNVRIVGLNSNSSSTDLTEQLNWLQTILDQAGTDDTIDFVFLQIHHPFKSELWTPGELDFTGDIIGLLETFSSTYTKPSIHFFGHTHAYSRGQSRDHNHLWVNVATAGGAIDNWGEFPNADYEEFVLSEDEYGFVMLEVEAGADPKFVLKRYSRGDENTTEDNTLSDEITIKRFDNAPDTPTALSPVGATSISCVNLKASPFSNDTNTHQATHWQLVEECDFSSPNVIDIWKQSTNFYNEVNTQEGDDLTDESIGSLSVNANYCWRVRYRNSNLTWSSWSTPISFNTTSPDYVTPNLLLNPGAESGIDNWSGDIEALTENECGSVPVYEGTLFFAVGGVCANEQTTGVAFQDIDVSSFSAEIDAENYFVEFSGYLRAFANDNDMPEMYIEFYDDTDVLLNTSTFITNRMPEWLLQTGFTTIPSATRTIRTILKGTRLSGADNDSYFDSLSVRLVEANCPILETGEINFDGDIKIFPNPVKDKLFYTSSTKVFKSISIIDTLGKLVYDAENVTTDFIDVSNLKSGVYIVSFEANNTSQNFKFIKAN